VDPAVIAIVFGSIFIVELPDKTFIAALVLSTRYRPLAVWVGVGLAFLVQTLIAVLAGQLATLLPTNLIKAVTLLIFLAGAFVLYRSAPSADEEEKHQEEEYAAKAVDARTGLRAVGASFLVLFAAEWGDLSQLATAGLAARYDDPLSVFIGSWAALLVVAGLAVFLGKKLADKLPIRLIRIVAAVLFTVFAVVAVIETIRLLVS
jgi:putative Ca2+/H+ antiporter (TMEM165/GDT1 family)